MQSSTAADRNKHHAPSIDTRLGEHRKLLIDTDAYGGGSGSESHDEDEESSQQIEAESQSIIGVSINKQQSWLASPTTLAVDKAAILSRSDTREWVKDVSQDYFGGTIPTVEEREDFETTETTSSREESTSQHIDLPSPWQAGPRELQFNNRSKLESSSVFRTSRRPRAFTGPYPPPGDSKKSSHFSLPSLPKFGVAASRLSLPSVTSALSFLQLSNNESNSSNIKQTSPTLIHTRSISERDTTPTLSTEQNRPSTSGKNQNDTEASATASTQPLLRRSTSDHSLYLNRTLSKASSLGDDTRWANKHGQVNSRFQAIKDSLADSSLRLPRMPIISINLPSFETQKAENEGISKEAAFTESTNRSLPPEAKRRPSPQSDRKSKPRSRSTTAGRSPHRKPQKHHAELHPHFKKMLKDIKGDVVILGGYRGSILRSAHPPHRRLWVPIKVGLNIRKVNLEVGLDDEDEEKMPESIIPSGMLRNIGPVDISRRLIKRMSSCENAMNGTLRVWDYGYDWRLSPHRLSTELIQYLEKLPCNKPDTPEDQRGAIVLSHSLGGLITRHAVNQRPELFSGVLYAGVPQTCVNILGPMRNGDDVLLSSRVLTAQVNFTIRTSYALLPLDGKCFVDSDTGEEIPVNFFDPQTWEDHCLSPCISRPHPPQNRHSFTSHPSLGTENSTNSNSTTTSGGVLTSLTSALPAVHRRNRSRSNSRSPQPSTNTSAYPSPTTNPKDTLAAALAPPPETTNNPSPSDPSTGVTLSPDAARAYLTRTLAATAAFKSALAHRPDLAAAYPPTAILYGKSIPTVSGARIRGGRGGIKHADAYDDLCFASGDGVVLAAASQLPPGYHCVRGGAVSSERGHISLLGDLEAVGRAVNAVLAERHRRRARKAAGS